jgi:uncharacterized cupredoxin-like copper-binding protein
MEQQDPIITKRSRGWRPPVRSLPLLAVSLLAIPLVACGDDNGTAKAAGPAVTERDYAITLSQSSGSAGPVTFTIKNDGPSTHELVVLKTDLPADKLPVEKSEVSETADGVTKIDEKEDIKSGDTATLSVDLKPGKYVLICNVTSHYDMGMHAAFTVS